jgi:hypothetical protein
VAELARVYRQALGLIVPLDRLELGVIVWILVESSAAHSPFLGVVLALEILRANLDDK